MALTFTTQYPQILDATQVSTGETVMLKRISRSMHSHEIDISRFFSTKPLASHPRNHCIPLHDVLDIPEEDDAALLVIPLLRAFDNPRLKSIGEAIEFFRQIFEVGACFPSIAFTFLFILFVAGLTVYA